MNDYGIIPQQEDTEVQRTLIDTASALEFTITTQGWKYIQDYIAEKKNDFVNKVLNSELKEITEISYQRGHVQGLLALLAEIESMIEQKERLTTK